MCNTLLLACWFNLYQHAARSLLNTDFQCLYPTKKKKISWKQKLKLMRHLPIGPTHWFNLSCFMLHLFRREIQSNILEHCIIFHTGPSLQLRWLNMLRLAHRCPKQWEYYGFTFTSIDGVSILNKWRRLQGAHRGMGHCRSTTLFYLWWPQDVSDTLMLFPIITPDLHRYPASPLTVNDQRMISPPGKLPGSLRLNDSLFPWGQNQFQLSDITVVEEGWC